MPALAYAGAGGPRPAGAQELTSRVPNTYSPTYGFRMKVSQVGCLVTPDSGRIECRDDDQHVDDGEVGGSVTASFEGGSVQKGFADDAPMYTAPGTFVLPYGETRYYGNVVFASTENGMTAWDTTTGHGVFMNKTQAVTF